MKILAIETSCDETAVCLIEAQGTFGVDFSYAVLGDALLSQMALHAPYGGVYPNLAKREHEKNLVPMLTECLAKSGALNPGTSDTFDTTILSKEQELLRQLSEFLSTHAKPDIDAIAVTYGPGLEPALWVGVNFAKALSQSWKLPVVAVNHMEGHIAIAGATEHGLAPVEFPALALLVSGGHTELVVIRGWGHYEIIGSTRDDAAGEAFDKAARLMGLPYPGGPAISKLAATARAENVPPSITFPRPMIHDRSYDFSFSGLKTAIRREVLAAEPLTDLQRLQFSREIEDAIVEVLVDKTARAASDFDAHTVIVSGGVSANKRLAEKMTARLTADSDRLVLFPTPARATDNAIMIALAGYFHAQSGVFADIGTLRARGGLTLGA